MTLRVQILNHASALLDIGGIRLLSDPWYSGPCFAGGWRLEYEWPEAIERAAEATHLWISHWHSDHFHPATLKALAQRNPSIRVLANTSDNFSMVKAMQRFGFTDIVELPERQTVECDGVSFCRYPTAGIDSMLHVQAGGLSVLNYNDCNLPRSALSAIKKRIGPIDLLLNNYNHAGKLFEPVADETVKALFLRSYDTIVDVLDPKFSVPFASAHYYSAPPSVGQNSSLITFDEVAAHAAKDKRLVALRVGDAATFDSGLVVREPLEPPLVKVPHVTHDYGDSIALDALLESGTKRCAELRRAFPGLSTLLRPLRVALTDRAETVELSLRKGARVTQKAAHIECHSRAMMDWVGRRFGDDTFLAGAHLGVLGANPALVQRWMLLATLEASELDLRRMAARLMRRDGLRFLFNRREEIVSTLANLRVKAGVLRI